MALQRAHRGVRQALRHRPEPGKRSRLAYLIGRYYEAIEADFRHFYSGSDVGELWRKRRWRLLLNLIDHLPRNTYYSQSVSDDEEHAKLLLKAQQEAGAAGTSSGPPMSTWSPEVGVMADLVDAVNALRVAFIAANTEKGAKKPEWRPYPRPQTALSRVKTRQRKQAHDALADRVLSRRRSNG